MSDFSVSTTLAELKKLQDVLVQKVKNYSGNYTSLSEEERAKMEDEIIKIQHEIQNKARLPETPKKPPLTEDQIKDLTGQLRQIFKK